MSQSILLLLFSIIAGVQSIPATEFTPCKRDDSVCLTKNANKLYKMGAVGVPELNIESQDPMYHDKIVADLGEVKYELRNTTIEGFKDCHLVNTKHEFEKSKIQYNLFCPHFNMYGVYQISGQLLTMPIEGDGDYSIKFKDYYLTIDTVIQVSQGKNGNRYMSYKSFKVNADLRGGAVADIKNLFNGQKEKEEAAIKLINNNQKAIVTLLQGPAFEANFNKLAKNFNECLKYVPVSSLIKE